VRIGGVPATVQYVGIVYAGEFQINVVVPALPDGDQAIAADIGGARRAGFSSRFRTETCREFRPECSRDRQDEIGAAQTWNKAMSRSLDPAPPKASSKPKSRQALGIRIAA